MNTTAVAGIAPEPCGLVIFGASEDLAARKLLPALLQLYRSSNFHERSFILGVGRTPLSDADFREQVRDVDSAGAVPVEFLKRCFLRLMRQADGAGSCWRNRSAEISTGRRT